ncbi:MAG: DHH family phosphoesterase [Candidatus Sericytochromatia bacterium]|nr:DHH family phosphoesterase [Candidatus Sericytochromatia bacterium]
MFSAPSEHILLSQTREVAKLLKENDNYLICPHIHPDPDSIGSAVGLYLGLRKLGKQVQIYLPEATPPYMDYLLQHADVQLEQPLDMNLKMIFVDLGTPKQLHPAVKLVNPWLDLDHHLGPVSFTKYAFVDQYSPATADIVFRVLKDLRCPMDKTIATVLYSALVFDTRNLTTPTTLPETLHQAADLIRSGADPTYVNQMLNQQKPINLMRLMGEAFSKIHSTLDDTLVWAVITEEMLTRHGVEETECDYLISDLLTVATAEVILLFKETNQGYVKVSWRSKCHVDVNLIARQFGGGGHRFACGARINLPLKQTVRQVIAATQQVMEAALIAA